MPRGEDRDRDNRGGDGYWIRFLHLHGLWTTVTVAFGHSCIFCYIQSLWPMSCSRSPSFSENGIRGEHPRRPRISVPAGRTPVVWLVAGGPKSRSMMINVVKESWTPAWKISSRCGKGISLSRLTISKVSCSISKCEATQIPRSNHPPLSQQVLWERYVPWRAMGCQALFAYRVKPDLQSPSRPPLSRPLITRLLRLLWRLVLQVARKRTPRPNPRPEQ